MRDTKFWSNSAAWVSDNLAAETERGHMGGGLRPGRQEIVLVIVTLAERVASRQILVVPVFSKVALIDGLPLKGVVRNATFDTKTQADSLQFVLFHLRSMVMHFPCRWVGNRCVSRSC